MLVTLNIPWLCTATTGAGCYLKVLSNKKTAEVFTCARRKLLLPTHCKGMFGEKLKSAVRG